MLELIIKLLQSAFSTAAYFKHVHGLAQIIQKEDKKFPAIYCGKDELDQINLEDSTIYFRQNGRITRSQDETKGVSGCDEQITINIPIMAVAYLPKNVFNTDNAYIDEKVATNIANIITRAQYNGIRSLVHADNITANINSIETDKQAVWRGEYSNVDFKVMHDHVYCAVAFTVEVIIDEACLTNFECNDLTIDVEGCNLVIIMQDPRISNQDIEDWNLSATKSKYLKAGIQSVSWPGNGSVPGENIITLGGTIPGLDYEPEVINLTGIGMDITPINKTTSTFSIMLYDPGENGATDGLIMFHTIQKTN